MSKNYATLGIRNCNPGNIRISKDHWEGLKSVQTDPAFFQFESMAYGVRAMAKLLLKYQNDYHLDTITKIIHRYAPKVENPTSSYILTVATKANIGTEEVIDLHDFKTMKAVIKGMIFVEVGGNKVKDADIEKGIALAGVIPKKKPLVKSRTLISATTGTIGASAAAVEMLKPITEAKETLEPVVSQNHIFAFVFLGLTVLCFLIIGYSYVSDRKKRIT